MPIGPSEGGGTVFPIERPNGDPADSFCAAHHQSIT